MSPRGPHETIEGIVTAIPAGGKALFFHETGMAEAVCIPLSQVVDVDYVKIGDTQIEVTKWILDRLEEEGRR